MEPWVLKENQWYCKLLSTSVNFFDNFGYFYLFYASVALMVEYAGISWIKVFVAAAISAIVSFAWALTMQLTANANCWVSVVEQPQNLINHGLQLMLLVLTVTIFMASIFLPVNENDTGKIRFGFTWK